MEEDILFLADSFIEKLKETPVYTDYREKKERISADPELYEAATELHEAYLTLCLSKDGEELSELAVKFAEDNQELLSKSLVYEYLEARAAFQKMVREVLDRVIDRL